MKVFLNNNFSNLNDITKLDKFLARCAYSQKLFTITRNDQCSTNPVILQWFLQGSLINTLYAYFHKFDLDDGHVSKSSSVCHHTDDYDD